MSAESCSLYKRLKEKKKQQKRKIMYKQEKWEEKKV